MSHAPQPKANRYASVREQTQRGIAYLRQTNPALAAMFFPEPEPLTPEQEREQEKIKRRKERRAAAMRAFRERERNGTH